MARKQGFRSCGKCATLKLTDKLDLPSARQTRGAGGHMPMLPEFLLPETTIREAGAGPNLSLGDNAGETLIVTLGINRIVEQESIDVSIWGSADAIEWGAKPLASYPQKFYCGVYQIVLDLSGRPDVKYLRVRWQASRWGKGEPKPLFAFYVFAQTLQPVAAARA